MNRERNLLYSPKKLELNNKFFTVYIWGGKFLFRPCLEILDEDGNIIYKEKSYSTSKLHKIFDDDKELIRIIKLYLF